MTGRYHVQPAYFRVASADDIAELTLMTRQTIAASFRRILGVEKVVHFLESGAADTYLAESVQHKFCPLLLHDQMVVGFAVCARGCLELILIDYRFQRRGFGRQLLRHCEDALFKQYPVITLQSFQDNDAANELFSNQGWKHTLSCLDSEAGARTNVYRKWRPATRKRKAVPLMEIWTPPPA